MGSPRRRRLGKRARERDETPVVREREVGDRPPARSTVEGAKLPSGALVEILKPYLWTLALQGHTHVAEKLPADGAARTRYHTAPAVNRPRGAEPAAGFFVYGVDGSEVDDGELDGYLEGVMTPSGKRTR